MKLVLLAIILGLLACPWCEAQSEDKGCVIELSITGDFPPDRIEPEVANLSGKDVRDNYFAPGQYRLEIAQPGYFPISEDVTIPEGQKVLRIERMMRAKPRRIQWKITHDVPPPENHPPYEITLAPINNPQGARIAHDGDEVEPGNYSFQIKQMGYEPVDERKYVWPADEPFVIEKELVAKPVMIQWHITYDVEPVQDLSECQLELLHPVTRIACRVLNGQHIKPGTYYLDAQRPGYSFGTRKEIEILPSEQPYVIQEKLLKKPRPFESGILELIYENRRYNVYQIVNPKTGKDITFQDKLVPGQEVELVVKFRHFKTMKMRVKIVDNGQIILPEVPLTKLLKYEFTTRQNSLELDKIEYYYMLYVDAEPIESHLVECEQGSGGRWMWWVWVDHEAKSLVVYAGYMFAEISLDKVVVSGIPRLTEIHIPRLIEHLEKVSRREARAYAAALDVLATLLHVPPKRSKLKAAPAADIRRLLEYVQGWKLTDPQEQARCKTVIEALEGLAGAR